MADVNTIADYIFRRAQQVGVNPYTALGIARYEGLNPNKLGSSTFGNPDAAGYSFGPFQLYSGSSDPTKIAPGGMAYEFKQKYGEAPSRENWKGQVDFALDRMRTSTSPWYAVRDQGGIEAITDKGRTFATEIGLNQTPNFEQKYEGPSFRAPVDQQTAGLLSVPQMAVAQPPAQTEVAAAPEIGNVNSLGGGIFGLASLLGSIGGGGGGSSDAEAPAAPAQVAAVPAQQQTEPVYGTDLLTSLRRAGNWIAPDLVEPAKPLTEKEIAAEKAQRERMAQIGQTQKNFGALAALGSPQQAATEIPTPQTRPVAYAPLKRYRTLREISGLLG